MKPLGTGCLPILAGECTGTPVKEFRGTVFRTFLNGRMNVGVNFLVAGGYAGQTTENFCQNTNSPAACDPSSVQEVVGVRIPSYAGLSLTYKFGRTSNP